MITCFKTVEVVILCSLSINILCFDYCSFKGCKHTMCLYPAANKVGCPGKNVKVGLNDEQRRVVLDLHNALRAKVANGEEPGQPEASNMMKMFWNAELEMIAQRWANQCQSGHDSCRALKDGTVAGQNVGGGSLKLKIGANRTLVVEEAFASWYKEVQFLDPAQITKFTSMTGKGGQLVGHYTELVFANVKEVGCGYIEKPPANDWFQLVNLICNYAPSGNVMGTPIYKVGKACSACPSGTRCSKKWPGLCTGEKDEFNDISETFNLKDSDKGTRATLADLSLVCVLSGFSLLLF